jgi:hypothetical protein
MCRTTFEGRHSWALQGVMTFGLLGSAASDYLESFDQRKFAPAGLRVGLRMRTKIGPLRLASALTEHVNALEGLAGTMVLVRISPARLEAFQRGSCT